jgi:hypothetical protein
LVLRELQPFVNYNVIEPVDYIYVQEENVAVHQATSIEEIAEAIVTEENEKGDDNIDIDDEPVVPKISISKALSAANDLTYFLSKKTLVHIRKISLISFVILLVILLICIILGELSKLLTLS